MPGDFYFDHCTTFEGLAELSAVLHGIQVTLFPYIYCMWAIDRLSQSAGCCLFTHEGTISTPTAKYSPQKGKNKGWYA